MIQKFQDLAKLGQRLRQHWILGEVGSGAMVDTSIELSPRDRKILKILASSKKRLQTRQIATALGVKPSTIGSNLSRLKKANVIENLRGGASPGYCFTPSGRMFWEVVLREETAEKLRQSPIAQEG